MKKFYYKKHNIFIQLKISQKKCVFSIQFKEKFKIKFLVNIRYFHKHNNVVYIALLLTLIPIWLSTTHLLLAIHS